jgi:hypothetical protein
MATFEAVVDQLRGLEPRRQGDELFNGTIAVDELPVELLRVGENQRFELVELQIGDEAWVSDIGRESALQNGDSQIGIRVAPAVDEPGKFVLQTFETVKVDHGRKPGIRVPILPHPAGQISLELLVPHETATIDRHPPPARLDASRHCRNTQRSDRRSEHLIDERLLGLSFDDDVQPNDQAGRPPSTFFSQSSDREYSASHSWRSASSRRRKVDSGPFLSTTTTSSGEK